MPQLLREKLSQAVDLVANSGADVWMTFVRETAMCADPALALILDGGLTWNSALIVGKDGRKIAVVGNYDADPLVASGNWDEVVTYVQDAREPILNVLETMVGPGGKIAVNFSTNDEKADGLSHGMYLLLKDYLRGTRFDGSLVTAESIVMPLRSVKTKSEVARMKGAIEETVRLFADIDSFAKVGVTERQVYDHVHTLAKERGLGFSWDPVGDPIVNSGPDSMVGHGIPSETLQIAPGHIFHVDLGVIKDSYASDIQRCWYVPHPGEEILPEDVDKALHAVVGAITAGSEALRPGAEGWTVDQVAREYLVAQGFEEFMHAFGHQVGRAAHDGGALLGPKWARYGDRPIVPIREGEVYTLELGVMVEGRGYLGLEEMVRVTSDGVEWLSNRQTELPFLNK